MHSEFKHQKLGIILIVLFTSILKIVYKQFLSILDEHRCVSHILHTSLINRHHNN